MKKRFIAIVGGGFSGLCLANLLEKNVRKDCVVFERLDRVGKKILATGNGRGNFSNRNLSTANYHTDDPFFVDKILKRYDNKVIEDFFMDLGVAATVEEDRVYPESLQANALNDALRLSLLNTEIKTAETVETIKKTSEGFLIGTSKGEYLFENVALCSGGMAAKNFGTDGSCYGIAKSLGHTVTELYPSLVQLRVDKEQTKGLKGVKRPAFVRLFDGEKTVAERRGDVLFSDGSVSGNTVFYLSSYVHGIKKPYLSIDFLPDASEDIIVSALKRRREKYPSEQAAFLLSGVVHTAVATRISKNLFDNKRLFDLTDNDLLRAVKELKSYRVDITGTGSFDNAQVTHGGVTAKEIDGETMMSRICRGLYFCGEIINVDGDCGGYNMHWAFATACAAAKSINERFNNR